MELYPIGPPQPGSTALAMMSCVLEQKGGRQMRLGGGRNKKLAEDEEATLKLYCERCILASEPLERKHIQAAANSILRAARKKPVSKPWLTR
jgi:hypothetical protein